MVRGIRGATSCEENSEAAILRATRELFERIIDENKLEPDQTASVLATVTDDLDAAFPALAVRSLPGWEMVPTMCAREIPVPTSMKSCIRLLIHVNTDTPQADIRHVYLGHAAQLRPDLASEQQQKS